MHNWLQQILDSTMNWMSTKLFANANVTFILTVRIPLTTQRQKYLEFNSDTEQKLLYKDDSCR